MNNRKLTHFLFTTEGSSEQRKQMYNLRTTNNILIAIRYTVHRTQILYFHYFELVSVVIKPTIHHTQMLHLHYIPILCIFS